MSCIKLPLINLDYKKVDFSEIKSKTQEKIDHQLKDLSGIEYYQEKKSKSFKLDEAIKHKNIDELTEVFIEDFRDLQLSRAMAKATIFPKGDLKNNVPTKKDNEAFFRKQQKNLKKLSIDI